MKFEVIELKLYHAHKVLSGGESKGISFKD